jgi:hypothetical protein
MSDIAARAICREKCAFYGEPPCWQISDEWPNPHCDEPGCSALGVAAAIALGKIVTETATPGENISAENQPANRSDRFGMKR